jgi:hypothetical protein
MSRKNLFYGKIFAEPQGDLLDTVNAYNSANSLSPLEDNNANSESVIYTTRLTASSILENGQYHFRGVVTVSNDDSHFWTYYNSLKTYTKYRFFIDVRSADVTSLEVWIRQIYWGTEYEYIMFDGINSEWTTFSFDAYTMGTTSQAFWFYFKEAANVSIIGETMEFRNFKAYEILNVFNPFITTWETTTVDEVITIPLSASYRYNFIVDWGDGSKDTYSGLGNGSTCTPTHTYAVAGSYDVSIEGVFPAIYFNNNGSELQLKDIKQWGDVVWQTMAGAFYGCENMTITATDAPNLTNVTTFQNMLRICRAVVNSSNLANWDVSNVSNFGAMFRDATGVDFTNSGIENWNMSSATELGQMFLYSNLDMDLGNWDISLVGNGGLFNLSGNDWSTANYDATLIGWASQAPNIQSNVTFDMGSVNRTSASASAYALLTGTYGWTINDNGEI